MLLELRYFLDNSFNSHSILCGKSHYAHFREEKFYIHVGLELNIQKTKIMASGPITSWQIDEEIMETVRDFLGGAVLQITVDGDYSHEIKRHLFLGRKAMTNLDSILKSKTMVFPVLVYGCERKTIKKAEHQRTDASELWCRRRLLRVPWTARRSSQSILKEISPEY